MIDGWLRRGERLSLCYNHQSAYTEENGEPAPALAYYDAVALVEGGKIVRYGAKTLPYGGWWAMPPLAGDGWMIVGDSAGFLNAQRLKGIHLAIKSGMLAAETAFDALVAGNFSAAQLLAFKEKVDASWIKRELYPVRNFHQGFEGGLIQGFANAALQQISGGRGLMERYPEYKFSASQPELYMFVKENHPEIYKQIKRRVKEGRWELCGAPWVEQDSQMPCGEALVRQFLYGNRFFEQEFGMRTRVAWLPDAFGFPWSLPQIMRKAQIDTFFTTKLSWNRYSRFPHSYFVWQGVDGTRIRALMMMNSYNGNPVPEELNGQWDSFAQRDTVAMAPFSFGWGDGGGGRSCRAKVGGSVTPGRGSAPYTCSFT